MRSLQPERMYSAALPTRSEVQRVSREHLSDQPEVVRFLWTIFGAFPCEVPAAQFSSHAVIKARRALLAHGLTLRGREQTGQSFSGLRPRIEDHKG